MSELLREPSDLAASAQRLLDVVCRQVGVDSDGAVLLRLRSNAVFKLRTPLIVRIATAPAAAERMPMVLSVTRWLARRGFPTVRPADHITEQPLLVEGTTITFWEYVPTAHVGVTTADLGQLLHRLHRLAVPDFPLRTLSDPLASVRTNLRQHPDALSLYERTWLAARIDDLTAQWETLPFAEPPVIVHGDAWIDNLLRHRDGHPVLCDWDSVAIGPREWDLVHSHHGEKRFGLRSSDIDGFTNAYGYDLREWAGYETLMAIRDLYAIGIHIRNAHGDPFSHRELRRRINSLTAQTAERWHMTAATSSQS